MLTLRPPSDFLTCLLLACIAASPLWAANANRTWLGGAGAPGIWSASGNWSALPDAGDNLFFTTSAQTLSTNDRGNDFAVRKFDFSATGAAFTFAGDRIALSSTGIYNYSPATQTFNCAVSIATAATGVQNTGPVVFNNVISGAGGLNLKGPGLVQLNALNTFSGDLAILAGTTTVTTVKSIASPSSIGQCSRIVFGGGATTGTLNYTGAGDTWNRGMKVGDNTVATVGGGRILNNGSGPLVITAASAFTPNGFASVPRTLSFGGDNADINVMQMVIINNNTAGGGLVNVAKTDAGLWVLSGNNTYTGTTTVEAGTLLITGAPTGQGDYFVQGGATLGGTGTIGLAAGATCTVQSAGIVAPGQNGVGTLTVNGNVVIEAQAACQWQYGGGSGDRLAVTGTLSLPATATVNVTTLGGAMPVPAVLCSASALAVAGSADLSGWKVTGIQHYGVRTNGTLVVLVYVPPSGTAVLIR